MILGFSYENLEYIDIDNKLNYIFYFLVEIKEMLELSVYLKIEI